jgi:hypothetical protein
MTVPGMISGKYLSKISVDLDCGNPYSNGSAC